MVVVLCLFQRIDLRLNLTSSFMLRVVYFYRKPVIASHSYLHVRNFDRFADFMKPDMNIMFLEASCLPYILIIFNNQMVVQTL